MGDRFPCHCSAVQSFSAHRPVWKGRFVGEWTWSRSVFDRRNRTGSGASPHSAIDNKRFGAAEISLVILQHFDPRVGKDGVITVEESRTIETKLDLVEGMQFDRGYLSPYFVTDPDRMECVLENCLILICEKKVNTMKDLLPLLEQVAKRARPLGKIKEGRGANDTRPDDRRLQ